MRVQLSFRNSLKEMCSEQRVLHFLGPRPLALGHQFLTLLLPHGHGSNYVLMALTAINFLLPWLFLIAPVEFTTLDIPFLIVYLTHSVSMHPFSTLWKHQKTLRFSDVFKG